MGRRTEEVGEDGEARGRKRRVGDGEEGERKGGEED